MFIHAQFNGILIFLHNSFNTFTGQVGCLMLSIGALISWWIARVKEPCGVQTIRWNCTYYKQNVNTGKLMLFWQVKKTLIYRSRHWNFSSVWITICVYFRQTMPFVRHFGSARRFMVAKLSWSHWTAKSHLKYEQSRICMQTDPSVMDYWLKL